MSEKKVLQFVPVSTSPQAARAKGGKAAKRSRATTTKRRVSCRRAQAGHVRCLPAPGRPMRARSRSSCGGIIVIFAAQ